MAGCLSKLNNRVIGELLSKLTHPGTPGVAGHLGGSYLPVYLSSNATVATRGRLFSVFRNPRKAPALRKEPGFQSGPGGAVDADYMAPCLLVTKSSPPSGGGLRKKFFLVLQYAKDLHSFGVIC